MSLNYIQQSSTKGIQSIRLAVFNEKLCSKICRLQQLPTPVHVKCIDPIMIHRQNIRYIIHNMMPTTGNKQTITWCLNMQSNPLFITLPPLDGQSWPVQMPIPSCNTLMDHEHQNQMPIDVQFYHIVRRSIQEEVSSI